MLRRFLDERACLLHCPRKIEPCGLGLCHGYANSFLRHQGYIARLQNREKTGWILPINISSSRAAYGRNIRESLGIY